MGMIMKNGVPYASGSEIPEGGTKGQVLAKASNISGDFEWVNGGGDSSVELTQAEYDALSTEEKNNGTTYFVTDSVHGGGGSGGGAAVYEFDKTSTDTAYLMDIIDKATNHRAFVYDGFYQLVEVSSGGMDDFTLTFVCGPRTRILEYRVYDDECYMTSSKDYDYTYRLMSATSSSWSIGVNAVREATISNGAYYSLADDEYIIGYKRIAINSDDENLKKCLSLNGFATSDDGKDVRVSVTNTSPTLSGGFKVSVVAIVGKIR